MRIFFSFMWIFLPVFLFAQEDLEQSRDGLVYEESGRALLFVNVIEPFAHFNDNDCEVGANFQPASFPSGNQQYKNELERYILGYIDRERYALRGPFYLTLDLGAEGNIREIILGPKVQNSEYFFNDMRFVVKRIKEKWIPAKCGNDNTDSLVRIRINFNSDVAE